MHEDLPAPVAPEMRMWGMSARFTITGRPAMSRPRATSSGCVAARGLLGGEHVAQGDELALAVGNLDADGRTPGIGARMRTSGEAMA